jgi:hypothetical protein
MTKFDDFRVRVSTARDDDAAATRSDISISLCAGVAASKVEDRSHMDGCFRWCMAYRTCPPSQMSASATAQIGMQITVR